MVTVGLYPNLFCPVQFYKVITSGRKKIEDQIRQVLKPLKLQQNYRLAKSIYVHTSMLPFFYR
jgi:hypothetical protein